MHLYIPAYEAIRNGMCSFSHFKRNTLENTHAHKLLLLHLLVTTKTEISALQSKRMTKEWCMRGFLFAIAYGAKQKQHVWE